MNESQFTVWSVLLVVLHSIQPEAAAGAVCGGLFFWALSPNVPISTRFWLAVASVGTGYGVGLPAARSEDWAAWTWIFAGVGASLAHVVIVSMMAMVNANSNLPPWLLSILDLLPWRRDRG